MDETTELRLRSQRRRALVFLYVAFVLGGVRAGYLVGLRDNQILPGFVARTDLLLALLYSLGCMWFCTVDSKLLGKPIIQLAKLGIFLLWPLGVPLYLLWAHHLRGLGVLLLHSVGLVLTALGTTLATASILYGNAWYT